MKRQRDCAAGKWVQKGKRMICKSIFVNYFVDSGEITLCKYYLIQIQHALNKKLRFTGVSIEKLTNDTFRNDLVWSNVWFSSHVLCICTVHKMVCLKHFSCQIRSHSNFNSAKFFLSKRKSLFFLYGSFYRYFSYLVKNDWAIFHT